MLEAYNRLHSWEDQAYLEQPLVDPGHVNQLMLLILMVLMLSLCTLHNLHMLNLLMRVTVHMEALMEAHTEELMEALTEEEPIVHNTPSQSIKLIPRLIDKYHIKLIFPLTSHLLSSRLLLNLQLSNLR